MIIGNGLIATAMKNSDTASVSGVTIFASGVSNSQETRSSEFEREKMLLRDALEKGGRIIYFSTIPKGKSPYMLHKQNMENIIHAGSCNYLILRTQYIFGKGGNPNNIVNYMIDKILKGEEIQLYKGARRSVIDVDDLVRVVDRLSGGRHEFAGIEFIRIEELAMIIANSLNADLKYRMIYKSPEMVADNDYEVTKIINDLGIESRGYIKKTIKKHIKIFDSKVG